MSARFYFLRSLAPKIRAKLAKKRDNAGNGSAAQPFFVSPHSYRQAKLLTLAVLFAIAGSSTAANVNGEQRRVENNAQKLLQIHAPVRAKFAAVIEDLEEHEQYPFITEAWRSEADQLIAFRTGHSKVTWGFHNATRNGRPDALAMDCYSNRYWFQRGHNDFYLRMANSARNHGLYSGCFFYVTKKVKEPAAARKRAALTAALDRRDWQWQGELGWDAGHTQTMGVSVAQAKAGKRPNYSK